VFQGKDVGLVSRKKLAKSINLIRAYIARGQICQRRSVPIITGVE